MKAELIEYDYVCESLDCSGSKERASKQLAILFSNDFGELSSEVVPWTVALPVSGILMIHTIMIRNKEYYFPVYDKKYAIIGYKKAPFQSYRVIKVLDISLEEFLGIEKLILDIMKVDDARDRLMELIRTERGGFGFG